MAMKIDRYVNLVLSKIFGPEDEEGNRKARFHSQNLNEDKKGNVKGWPVEGRWWLYYKGKTIHHFSWHLWTHFCGASIKSDHEDGDLGFHVSIPPVAFWWTLPIPIQKMLDTSFWANWNERTGGYRGSHRYTAFSLFDISIHDWSIHWDLLKFDWGWSREMPKWMDGHLNLQDFFLGRSKYTSEVLETQEVLIPMPEGSYPATVKIERCVWKRPRWFAKVREDARVDIPWGIPHEGKGENSWDCGEDRLYGCGSSSTRISKIIGDTVASALRGREKYNSKGVKAVYPPPAPPTPSTPAPPNVASSTQGEAKA